MIIENHNTMFCMFQFTCIFFININISFNKLKMRFMGIFKQQSNIPT